MAYFISSIFFKFTGTPKEAEMSKLFETTKINGMQLFNRFLAEGGVGLIITSHAYIRPDGQAGPRQLGIYKDELIGGLREMTRRVHKHGSRIALQITHAGFFANVKLTGQRPKTPSQVDGFARSPREEMAPAEIQDIVEAFSQAARRAREANFDGVQIHAAHGYLLSQFLSPAFNKRTDRYGGTVENRARFLLEVLQILRATLGPDFAILVKINSQDFLGGGLTAKDSLQVGAMLQEKGIGAIELSGGTIVSGDLSPSRRGITSEQKEGYFKKAAKAFKERFHVPLILVGGIRSFQVAERLVDEKYADYISMSRPFIREPALVSRWASGDLRRATCLSDNQCFAPARSGEGIYCVVEKKGKEQG
jgi:2,4-dienoyl-CoA reductase-like NADH-dependent reductase (Old Yellow Enzyme family)